MLKYVVLLLTIALASQPARAQGVAQQLAAKIQSMENLPQMKHGVVSLYVADAATGAPVYAHREEMGLMPASNLKVFTAIAALEMLGSNYRYNTEIGYSGHILDSTLYGNLFVVGNGDPTLGSWRYPQTKEEVVMAKIGAMLRKAGINKIMGDIILDGSRFSHNPVPGGWAWNDIGSYYGAGSWALNWHENQYDLILKPSKTIDDAVGIQSTAPKLDNARIINEMRTAAPGTGDNSYPYLPPYGSIAVVEGTIPAGSGSFTVSGSLPEPYTPIAAALQQLFAGMPLVHNGTITSSLQYRLAQQPLPHYDSLIGALQSPPLDSIINWFMKKSINLYGEDLLKTLALQKYGTGSTDSGVAILKQFWQQHGIEKSALRVIDGSGLSPNNHVTTHSLVQALLWAKSRPWFPAFYQSLPLYNGMHMKSGTIGGVKSFSGYHTSAKGRQYAFSMIVNNYDGATDAIVNRMYGVLDELK